MSHLCRQPQRTRLATRLAPPLRAAGLVGCALALTACANHAPMSAPQPPNDPRLMGVIPASAPETAPSTISDMGSALRHYHWRLDHVTAAMDNARVDVPPEAHKRPELVFLPPDSSTSSTSTEGHIVVKNLCNTLSGHYQLSEPDRIHTQSFIRTKKACADAALMNRESVMAEQLAQVQYLDITPRIAGPITSASHPAQLTLKLRFPLSTWTLTGTPNDALRHGGPAQRVFLELKPGGQSCLKGSVQYRVAPLCFDARTVRYNAQGIQQQVGAWQPLQHAIEGFQPEAHMRYVLRLNHWPKSASTQQPVYVLDMVVETARVQ